MKKAECDCLILCGGLGKRLRGVVEDVPKVMADVNGRPFLDYMIEYLKSQDIERIVLCTGYKAEMVEDYYRDHAFDLTIDFSREWEPLGTAGGLKNAEEIISSNPMFVLNGDSFLPVDLQSLLDFHLEKKALASMIVTEVPASDDYGSVVLDENKRITAFDEKIEGGSARLVNAGIYCFDQEVLGYIPSDQKCSLERDIFPQLTVHGFFGYRVSGQFMDIGTPERYRSAQTQFKKRE